jgi:hypothetical protein
MDINETYVNKEVVDKIRRVIPSVPDKLTIRESVKYTLSMRAVEGDMSAYKELIVVGKRKHISSKAVI